MDKADLERQIEDALLRKAAYLALADAYGQKAQAMQSVLVGMEGQDAAEAAIAENLAILSPASRPIPTGKPRTQLYEEVLREHGQPMHLTDLLDAVQARGVRFGGSRDPREQLRSALHRSARFVRVGRNLWELTDG